MLAFWLLACSQQNGH